MMHQRTTQRAFVESHRHLIGKTREHAARNRARRSLVFGDVETFLPRDREKLLPKLSSLACRARIHSQARTPPRIEVVLLRETKGTQENEKVGFIFASEQILALPAHLFALGAAEQVATLGERGNKGDGAHAALLLRGEK